MVGRLRSARGRMYTIVIDQAVSGASNILVGLIAAHLLGLTAFGWFTLVFFAVAMALAVPAGLVSQPMLVHPEDADTRSGEGIGATLLVSAWIGALFLAIGGVGLINHWVLGGSFVILGLCLPLMFLQDFGRYLGFATQQPMLSLVLDLLWLALEIAGFVGLLVFHAVSLTTFVACWGVTGALAGLLVLRQYRHSRVVLSMQWVRDRWAYSSRNVLVATTTLGTVVIGSFALLAITSAAAVGAVRGALLLVRPYQLVQQAMNASAATDIARSGAAGSALWHLVRSFTLRAGVLAIVNMLLLAFLPDPLGRLALGDTWPAVEPIIVAAAIQSLAIGLATGPRAAMMGRRIIRTTMWVDLLGALLVLACMLSGSAMGDAKGAMWGAAAGSCLILPVYWLVYARVHPTFTEGGVGAT